MSLELQTRAKAFLARPIPSGIHYVPGSLAERFIQTYAHQGHLPDDAETMELVGLAGMEATAMSQKLRNPAAADYFRETSALLESILAEQV